MDRLRRWKKRVSKSSVGDEIPPNDPAVIQAQSTPSPSEPADRAQYSIRTQEDPSVSRFQPSVNMMTPEEIGYSRFLSERADIERNSGLPVREDQKVQVEDSTFSDDEYLGSFGVRAFNKGNRFPYKPLDRSRNEIRLLTIIPPREWVRNTASSLDFCSEPIQCLLEHVSLDEVRNDLERPARPSQPRRTSGPARRALPPGYLDGDSDDPQMDRCMELITRAMNFGWMSQQRKAILSLQQQRLNGKLAQYFPPGTPVKFCPENEYLSSFIWTPIDLDAMATPESHYFALSYPWGDLTDLRAITVNGTPVAVSKNLEAALRAVREMPDIEYGAKLWVDALCINQLDIYEKSREVMRMSEIFRDARQVISWVGHDEDGSDEAIDFILAGYRQVRGMPGRNSNGEDSIEPFLRWWLSNPHVLTMEPGLPIAKFFSRPYWRRMWIVQEVLLGRLERGITICGKRRASTLMVILWGRIVHGMIQREGMIERTNALCGALMPSSIISAIEELNVSKMHTWDLNTIRSSALMSRDVGRLEASEQRDLVYGQLGILHPAISRLVIINYQSDVRQVYANFAFAVVKGTQSLDWILEVRYRWNWPSWVPKIGEQIHWPLPKRAYSAGGNGLPEMVQQVGPCGLQLQCVGIFIGTIVRVGLLVHPKHLRISQHRYGDLQGLRAATRACYNAKNEDPAGPTFFDIPFHNQLAGVVADVSWYDRVKVRALSDEVSRMHSAHWWDFWGHRLEELITVPGNHEDSMVQLIHGVLNCQLDAGIRDLFITDTGYLGSIELTLAEGENLSVLPGMDVWVLLGSGWPVVLWGGSGKFKMIGRCYVHGIMNSEALHDGRIQEPITIF